MLDEDQPVPCQAGCGACCIAPEISSPIPGMPNGKAAGIRCIHLKQDLSCSLFGQPSRPKVCEDFLPTKGLCGYGPDHALSSLMELEVLTRSDA